MLGRRSKKILAPVTLSLRLLCDSWCSGIVVQGPALLRATQTMRARRNLDRKTRGHGLGIQNGRSGFGPARVLPSFWCLLGVLNLERAKKTKRKGRRPKKKRKSPQKDSFTEEWRRLPGSQSIGQACAISLITSIFPGFLVLRSQQGFGAEEQKSRSGFCKHISIADFTWHIHVNEGALAPPKKTWPGASRRTRTTFCSGGLRQSVFKLEQSAKGEHCRCFPPEHRSPNTLSSPRLFYSHKLCTATLAVHFVSCNPLTISI